MNLQEILSIADHNKAEARYEAAQKRYSTSLPPPKKMPKPNIQSIAVKQFLAKKQAEEERKAEEARQKKAELLALRAQNSKNNKKAKIMASRTKDNDFSRIKLTEDEVEAKKKREQELRQLALKDKVERMKARIEMEEKEKLLPKKRKRKNKHGNEGEEESHADYDQQEEPHEVLKTAHVSVKKAPPPPPSLSFHDLLRVAQEKQFEPVLLPKAKVEDDKPMTKKAKKLLEEEENRIKRKLAAQAAANASKLKLHDEHSPANAVLTKLKIPKLPTAKSEGKQSSSGKDPVAMRVQTHSKDSKSELAKQNTMKSKNTDSAIKNNVVKKGDREISKNASSNPSKHNQSSSNLLSNSKNGVIGNAAKPSSQTNFKSKPKGTGVSKSEKSSSVHVSCNKTKPVVEVKKKAPPMEKKKSKPAASSSSNGDLLSKEMLAEIEKRIREQVQKELEEKLKQASVAPVQKSTPPPSQSVPKGEHRTNIKKPPVSTKPPSNLPPPVKAAPSGKMLNGHKPVIKPSGPVSQPKVNPVRTGPAPPPKKPPPPFEKKVAFHPNPYIQPPRRLLETRRPIRPAKRRLESDDEDDEEDDMSDFIDDGPELMEESENYSEYIKDIFGYDRSRYIDDDDDDIMETPYSEQLKEEIRSAKLGYKEDLEDIKREQEELARKKKKKKK